MKGKLMFAAGVGVGYVLGARAGRERYEQIAGSAQKVWSDPKVQEKVGQAEEFAREKADDVATMAAVRASEVGEAAKHKAAEVAEDLKDAASGSGDTKGDTGDAGDLPGGPDGRLSGTPSNPA